MIYISFNRDIDQFRFPEDHHKDMAPGPYDPYDHPYGPLHGSPPPFGPPFLPPPFPMPPPFSRKAFQDIKTFIILIIISEHQDGITGYQLQEKFKFPRGTLLRTLDDLEEKGYVKIKEDIIKGRAQKIYTISQSGRDFLEHLKMKWATQFARMSDMAPPEQFIGEGMKAMCDEHIKNFTTKDDTEDFFRGIRSWVNSILNRIEHRRKNLLIVKSELDKSIENISKIEELNIDSLKKLIDKFIKKLLESQEGEDQIV